MYVAVKGGEAAIENAHRLLAHERRGDPSVPELGTDQIAGQLAFLVDRVMAEGCLYDPGLAALAIKQARGDVVEAVFLLRAYRNTLPRVGACLPLDTDSMTPSRRISATFKDLPGGQALGATFDYTHRLLDFLLEAGGEPLPPAEAEPRPDAANPACATGFLEGEGLIEREVQDDTPPGDLTREPLEFPCPRDVRLQALARGDEGFLLALGYSTQRGYGRTHPFVGELRQGWVEVEVLPPELGFAVPMGRIELTECQMVNQFRGSAEMPPQFTRGYGLAFGKGERRAMAMALVDRALRARELGEERSGPAQDEEFVLAHADTLQATGFVEHLKLPHYVDFQAELELLRRLRAEHAAREDETREAAE